MYYVRKLTYNEEGEVGYWKKLFSIYPSPLPSTLKRSSENLRTDDRLLLTAHDLQTSLPPPKYQVSY